jgi:hypothetical protein
MANNHIDMAEMKERNRLAKMKAMEEAHAKRMENRDSRQEIIENAGFANAPISPIDYMHQQLRAAGYKTDEITGRSIGVNYAEATPSLMTRKASIRQRLAAIKGFNGGTVDALILNQSGATGLSLHASEKFKDQRRRHMIIVQAEKNIDTHVQLLGRVLRTGQVVTPTYTQAMADIPAEMRPAAILAKKMASLSANTTASRKSAVSAENVVDFMNDYGGQVAVEFLSDNPDLHQTLGGQKGLNIADSVEQAKEDDIRRLTGYLPVLPIAQQEQIYADLISRYNELIERENSIGKSLRVQVQRPGFEHVRPNRVLALDQFVVARDQVGVYLLLLCDWKHRFVACQASNVIFLGLLHGVRNIQTLLPAKRLMQVWVVAQEFNGYLTSVVIHEVNDVLSRYRALARCSRVRAQTGHLLGKDRSRTHLSRNVSHRLGVGRRHDLSGAQHAP